MATSESSATSSASLNKTATRVEALWPWLCGLVILASILTSFSGTGSVLPLDAHEVFVARTAEEMVERGHWIHPYFNDESRLKKPPLAYWLVMSVNAVTGGDSVVTEFEARVPSAIAGISVAAMAIAIGCLLVDRRAGLLAGAMLVSCDGFITYTHSARPEMIYAAICTAGLLGFILAERWSAESTRKKSASAVAMLAWLAFGLATLTKGPQLPIPIIAGWLFGAFRAGTLRSSLRAVRPITGSLLYLVVSSWWFVVILLTVPDAGEVWKHETISRYTDHKSSENDVSWLSLLNPYYLYRPLKLLLPWAFFVPGMLAGPWLNRLKTKPGAMRLWWIVLFAAVLLSFSKGRRWYYMLPVLVPYFVMLASTAVQFAEILWTNKSSWKWAAVMGFHIVAVAAASILFLTRHGDRIPGNAQWMTAAIVVTGVACLAVLTRHKARHALGITGIALMASMFAAGAFTLAESRAGIWRLIRLDKKTFAEKVSQHVEAEAILFGWNDPWEEQIYYLHRPIPLFFELADISAALNGHEQAWVINDLRNGEFTLPSHFTQVLTLDSDYSDKKGSLQLWSVTASTPAP